MPLSPGDKLGPYEILEPIGKGGMGEVYRARDTRLGRDVAIKVSAERFSERFEREARVISSLNHSNICTLYDVGPNYLVMELVEGPTLAERIAEGALPLDEALDIARQITAALEEAHSKGITHRDLKPGNIKIRPDGTVKVLDFGLAKIGAVPGSDSALENSPTLSNAATQAGVILGTAGYMAPEQAKGRAVDKRADIWSFGVVLYEMVTGRRLFQGDDLTETLAAVVRDKAEVNAAPVELRRILGACLQKNPRDRLKDIGDVWRLLDEAPVAVVPQARPWGWIAVAVVAMVAALALGAALWRASEPEKRPLVRTNLNLPGFIGGGNLAISRDGTRIAYVTLDEDGAIRLATRLLEEKEADAKILPGTEGATFPFFSPDGQWIGFGASGEVRKVSVRGGPPSKLADAPVFLGGSWSDEGFIVAAKFGSLVRFQDSGQGQPETLTEGFLGSPQVLPGGKDVLVFGRGMVAILSLETKQITTRIPVSAFPQAQNALTAVARYLPTRGADGGHIIYSNGSSLMAIPFDLATLTTQGEPFPVLDDWVAGASFSTGGMFIYTIGAPAASVWPLRWLRRDGTTELLLETSGAYTSPEVSPDGRLLAVTVNEIDPAESRIMVYDWRNDRPLFLTEKGEAAGHALWTPDSQYLIWATPEMNGKARLVWKRADGSGEVHPLGVELATPYIGADSIAPDGKHILFQVVSGTEGDLWIAPLDLSKPGRISAGDPMQLQSPGAQGAGTFSPDGNWIAYNSNQSGQYEVWVRPFPGPGGGHQVSEGGGLYPKWSGNGELLYLDLQGLTVMDYKVQGEAFVASRPRPWGAKPQIRLASALDTWNLDPKEDRIVMISAEETGPPQVGLLINFFDELRRLSPAD